MVFFFGIILFIVWLIVRPPKQAGNSQNVVNVYPQQTYAHMYEPPPEAHEVESVSGSGEFPDDP